MLREPRGAGGGGSWFQGCGPPPRGAAEVLPARPPPAPAHPGSSARAGVPPPPPSVRGPGRARRPRPGAGSSEPGARSSGRVGLPGMLGAPRPGAIYSSRASRGRDGWCPGGPPDLLWLPHLPPKYNGGPASVPGVNKGAAEGRAGERKRQEEGEMQAEGRAADHCEAGPLPRRLPSAVRGSRSPSPPRRPSAAPSGAPQGPISREGFPRRKGTTTGWRRRGPGHRPRPAGGALRGAGTPTR